MANTYIPDVPVEIPFGVGERGLFEQLASVDTRRPLRGTVPTQRQLSKGEASSVDFRVSRREKLPASQAVRTGLLSLVTAMNPFTIEGPKLPLYFLALSGTIASWEASALTLAYSDIQVSLGLSLTKLITLGSVTSIVTLVLAFPLGYITDRTKRVRLLQLSIFAGVFSGAAQALAPTSGLFFTADAAGDLLGHVDSPAQASLYGDWFPTRSRARVFGFLDSIDSVGSIISGAVTGTLLSLLGWREATLLLAGIGLLVALMSLFLREPVRGGMDRLELGETIEDASIEQEPASFAEALRGSWSIRTLRLQAMGNFVESLAGPLGLITLMILRQRFGVDTMTLGFLTTLLAVVKLPAGLVGGALAQRSLNLRPSSITAIQGAGNLLKAAAILGEAFAPNLPLFLALYFLPQLLDPLIGPATSVIAIQVAPARIRGMASQLGSPFQIVALVIVPAIASQTAGFSLQKTLLVFLPLYVVGALIFLSSAGTVGKDINNARLAAAAEDDRTTALLRGADPILVCRGVEAGYGDVQILYGIDLDVHTGETVALLGTNGSGKSTLLKTICGQLEASGGAVYYAGRDVTHAPTYESAAAGIVYMPGGQAVFPALTVRENLIAAARSYDGDPVAESVERFPQLASRLDVVAGALSGGEQQQVALSQALLMKPKLLMIDELSLGLSPSVVESLLDLLRLLQTQGVTILLVEQSLNVAVTIADRALFMEKGSVSYDGPTAGLLARPDLIRAVFMGGAVGGARLTQRRVEESEADSVLKAEGITLSYGGVRALNDVSLVLQPGEVLGVIGSNGSGKSSLLDVLSGYTKPEAGQVLLDGVDVTELSPDARARAGLTRAFQNARLFGPLTVRETISLALERRTVKSAALAAIWAPNVRASERRIRERADGLMEILGLTLFSDKFIRELSTGTRRAVEVACMMAAEPKVLMLDEPSSGLAQAETEALGPALSRIVRETGCALLVIEHDLPLITSLSDRLLALELGTVLLTGTPTEVVNDPRVVSSYLSASEDVLARSGSRTTPTGKATS